MFTLIISGANYLSWVDFEELLCRCIEINSGSVGQAKLINGFGLNVIARSVETNELVIKV